MLARGRPQLSNAAYKCVHACPDRMWVFAVRTVVTHGTGPWTRSAIAQRPGQARCGWHRRQASAGLLPGSAPRVGDPGPLQ